MSEETGAISVAMDGKLKRHLTPEALDKLLRAELIREDEKTEKHSFMYYVRKFIKV